MSFRKLLRAPYSVGMALIAIAAVYSKRTRASNSAPKHAAGSTGQSAEVRAAELTRLTQHLLTVGDEEKARIARELHAGLGSTLTAVNLDLFWLQQRLGDQPALAARLARAREVLASTVEMKRHIMHDLHPTALDSLGLSAAIESYATDFSRNNSIPVAMELADNLPSLEPGAPIALFRICEEALTNTVRHAHATSIEIVLRVEPSCVILEVIDDGIGIDRNAPDGTPASVGLLSMRERAIAIGGTLSVERGANGRGTIVKAMLPLAHA